MSNFAKTRARSSRMEECLLSVQLGKLVVEKIQEVAELQEKGRFSNVSKAFNIRNLQRQIAKALNLDLLSYGDETKRASELVSARFHLLVGEFAYIVAEGLCKTKVCAVTGETNGIGRVQTEKKSNRSTPRCFSNRNIFLAKLLQNFPNLEQLEVSSCKHVEHIIVEVEMSDQGHHQEDSNTITLRNFKRLQLSSLPRLKSIYKGIMVCESLQDIVVDKCHTLRRLPLSLHMDNGQASAPPALRHIWGDNEWWESLDWDDSSSKSILSLCSPLNAKVNIVISYQIKNMPLRRCGRSHKTSASTIYGTVVSNMSELTLLLA
ncbi:Disease resistance protein RPS5 [Camellia lanceoleosa]|nr:Disease resistance protein RPS5 [Camellia lanceoleosa]